MRFRAGDLFQCLKSSPPQGFQHNVSCFVRLPTRLLFEQGIREAHVEVYRLLQSPHCRIAIGRRNCDREVLIEVANELLRTAWSTRAQASGDGQEWKEDSAAKELEA